MLAVAFVAKAQTTGDTLHYAEEKHFKNIQQLTFGGDNAEAYWSFDSKQIIFQRTNAKEGLPCDQMFIGTIPAAGDKFEYKMVSSAKVVPPVVFFFLMVSISFMLPLIWVRIPARLYQTAVSLAINIYGLSMIAMIFL
jgi:hypothetical protein